MFQNIFRIKTHRNRKGLLTFEWLLLFTLVVIGIVGGLAVMRDTVTVKYAQVGGALGQLDTSYVVKKTSEVYELDHNTISALALTNEDSTISIEVKNYGAK